MAPSFLFPPDEKAGQFTTKGRQYYAQWRLRLPYENYAHAHGEVVVCARILQQFDVVMFVGRISPSRNDAHSDPAGWRLCEEQLAFMKRFLPATLETRTLSFQGISAVNFNKYYQILSGSSTTSPLDLLGTWAQALLQADIPGWTTSLLNLVWRHRGVQQQQRQQQRRDPGIVVAEAVNRGNIAVAAIREMRDLPAETPTESGRSPLLWKRAMRKLQRMYRTSDVKLRQCQKMVFETMTSGTPRVQRAKASQCMRAKVVPKYMKEMVENLNNDMQEAGKSGSVDPYTRREVDYLRLYSIR
ncbi:uncharacterized protein B0T15DRAFT_509339 [Chaetomium strumarium]|uniref:Uncharacterized protein n=1 Tax=Chaetomium strumarium TaxID=1170767 RepID=A0AAJ0H029_9PEZI|nr:hypothetical protein B0T15DRAFT_509339 [Chaetomium strumarium]